MTDSWTVLKVLRWTTEYLKEKGIENPRLDAELLIGSALDKDRVGLYLCYDQPLHSDELAAIRQLVTRRASREPLQYILGQTEFWSLPFKVVPGVLIPRGDTEILVEEALRILQQQGDAPDGGVTGSVLDVGTGSGAIAVAIAHSCPELAVVALDISPAALELAQGNAELNGVRERLRFCRQDMAHLDGCCDDGHAVNDGRLRLIVSNPPYISRAEMAELMPEVKDHEPHLALEAGEDGLDCYRLLCAQALRCLQPGGWLVVEVGATQAASVRQLMEQSGLEQLFQRDDYSGIARVVGGCAPATNSAEVEVEK
ncbi:MAG: peptide chain release factor N(5)-glutamine methyltransferase [Desulfuromonas sp.]|nr:peptide chain release factor N(5)-glutamine methyltransferase [Desulfuromonas sp.]